MLCKKCGLNSVKNLGIRMMGNKRKFKYACEDCGFIEYSDTSLVDTKAEFSTNLEYNVDNNYVVTSATQGFAVNQTFLSNLLYYCKHNNATLIVIPVNNKSQFNIDLYDQSIKKYIVSKDIVVGSDIVIKSSIHLGTNLENPLHGMDALSKGKTLIFGHPQVQLKTLPRKRDKYPPIISTTGSVSDPDYSEHKTAQKANFNHSFSALFVSGDKNSRKLRHLNFDGNGFYDLDSYYSSSTVTKGIRISGIVTGDEHVLFYDPDVYGATYGKNGVVATLKPEFIFRHDVLDCHSISHHHNNNAFIRWAKTVVGNNKIQDELNKTIKFIVDTTPADSTSIIIPSNHNSHLYRWLTEYNPKAGDSDNLEMYHLLSLLVIQNAKIVDGIPVFPDPFELYARSFIPENVRFLSSKDDFLLHDIDVNNHGDLGVNGTKGSRLQYKNMPNKTVIGHSHSPGIDKGSYQVGTSSSMNLDYNIGPSTWHQCHCLIYPNGKRQLLFIVNGEWR